VKRLLYTLLAWRFFIIVCGSMAAFFAIGIEFDVFGREGADRQDVTILTPALWAQWTALFAPMVVNWQWVFHGPRRALKWAALLSSPFLCVLVLHLALK
jgi:hypothetical protein